MSTPEHNENQADAERLTPELLNWAREQLNEEETVAGLREIRETGGLQLEDFLQELEQKAMPGE